MKNSFYGLANALLWTANKGVYVGRIDGVTFCFYNGHLSSLSSGQPGIGIVGGYAETSVGLFAYGGNGLAIRDGNTFKMLRFETPEVAHTISGFLEAKNGDFWLNGSGGIGRIKRSELLESLTDPTHMMRVDLVREGNFVGPASFWDPTPSVLQDQSGKLWFSTINGVVSLDPQTVDRPQSMPLLAIRSATGDGMPLNSRKSFPSNVFSLNIRYFGVNLNAPRNVVYRYRLIGIDPGWEDVGDRTEAIYTQPKPGTYTFEVMASNGDGRWTAPITFGPFTVLPKFYQTLRFRIACICMVLARLFWVGVVMRGRSVAHAIQVRADERANERIRIARDIHDTLLQGVQGLILAIHVATQKIQGNENSRDLLQRCLSTADQLVTEGRDRVWQLRSDTDELTSLHSAIAAFTEADSGDHGIVWFISQEGVPSPLLPAVAEEVLMIVREAIANTNRHSGASRAEIHLIYGTFSFRVECRDDGHGFDAGNPTSFLKHRHWGMSGMLERARSIGARVTWKSSPGFGTAVSLRIPNIRAMTIRTCLKRLSKLSRDANTGPLNS